jgi:hypothetical protein
MTDAEPAANWKDATWTGNRPLQHCEFQALSLWEKVVALEEIERVSVAVRIDNPRHQRPR